MRDASKPALPSAADALQLPFDHYPTAYTPPKLASYAFELQSGLGRDERAPDALVAAAFGIMLFRYSGQSSLRLGASMLDAGGQLRWAEELCLATSDATTASEVIEAVGAVLDERPPKGGRTAVPNAEYPLSSAAFTLIEGANVDNARDVIANAPWADGGVALRLVVGDGSTQAAFVYNASVFRASSVVRFAAHLQKLLDGIRVDREATLSALALMTEAEESWLRRVCDGPTRPAPKAPLHTLFEFQAQAAPNAIALRHRDSELTYRVLNDRANRLAHYLLASGAGSGQRVCVCVEPAFDIAIALLAIWKAGATYVPLDPAYPPARIQAILDDTSPALVLTQSHLRDRLGLTGARAFALDTQVAELDAYGSENPGVATAMSQTATIYFTSGTTGKPKGAMASHANVAHYVLVAQDRYQIHAGDVMPAIARFSFSISMFELMSPLVAGGVLVLLDREHVLDLPRLARTLSEVTFFHAGPSLLKGVLAYIRRRYDNFSAFRGVRHASSGGDMVAPEVLEGLKHVFSQAEIFVIYGSTEVSCMGCTYAVPRDRSVERTFVGHPFDNVAVRLFDSAHNEVPVGVVGEIHFAGGGVVDGYLNRPELTAEKFIDVDGRRFYSMGDRGRLAEDGSVEILGRVDFQVKVRGMRVEVGEVEFYLRRAPGVRDAVAMAKANASGDKALVGYVVMHEDSAASIADIRQYMATSLPDYMVPVTYVELASLPLNHNMKVDRFALPDPSSLAPREPAARTRPPATRTEHRLAAIWQRLLGVRDIGRDDDFFDLGGHSMLALELILAVEAELGVTLDGMDVLRESLAVQASICDRHLGNVVRSAAAPSLLAVTPTEIFHFGPEQSLYGVLQGRAEGTCKEAVLICPPVGQEHVRAQFVLRKLARQLAAKGIPTLQFEYYGCGDSAGNSIDATCLRWQQNIASAYDVLRRRTQAERVTAVGVRLGATLLCQVAPELDLAKVVLWDAIVDGAVHLRELRELHRRYLRSVRHMQPWRRFAGGGAKAELLGLEYSERALRELAALKLGPATRGVQAPVAWLASWRATEQRAVFSSITNASGGNQFETLDHDSGWQDIAQLEEILPDVGVTRALAAMVERSL